MTDNMTTEAKLLHYAARNGQILWILRIIRSCINSGIINAKDNRERTALHLAAWNGHYQAVLTLAERGAKINARDENGATPLHRAAQMGNIPMIELLLNLGAEILEDNFGWTPINYAFLLGQKQAGYLLEKIEQDS